jgi:hypothetical protein
MRIFRGLSIKFSWTLLKTTETHGGSFILRSSNDLSYYSLLYEDRCRNKDSLPICVHNRYTLFCDFSFLQICTHNTEKFRNIL